MFKVKDLIKATGAKLIGKDKVTETNISGISLDTRTLRKGELFIAIKGNNFDGHDFIEEATSKGAAAVITQSSNHSIAKLQKNVIFIEAKDTLKALGDIARLQRKKINVPVIAVTGSNGKTTTKEMIFCVLSCAFKALKNEGTKNNHIGLPQTLLGLNNSFDLAVLEAGTNHHGEIAYLADICLPNIAVITNVGSSHLEYFNNLSGVLKEKSSLIKYLQKPCIVITNNDDNLLRSLSDRKKGKNIFIGFGINYRSDFTASGIKKNKNGLEFIVNKKHKFSLKTLGAHNVYNALAAIALGRIFGLEYKKISDSLSRFSFPQGRLQLLELGRVKFIDDTYNSNPTSLKEALRALADFPATGRKIFVMGDMLELGGRKTVLHRQAGSIIPGSCDTLITVGELSRFAAQAASRAGLETKNIFICEDTDKVREVLFRRISVRAGDIVLVKGSRSMKMEQMFKGR